MAIPSGNLEVNSARRSIVPGGQALLLAGVLLLVLWSSLACASPRGGDGPDPMAPYRPAMKSTAQSHLDELGKVPRYAIEVALDGDLRELRGRATINVPNTSPAPWTYLIFRLYPALDHYGGEMSIRSASVNDRATPFSYLERNTAVRVELPVALLPGQSAQVYFSWSLRIPQWQTDSPLAYRLFGHSQEMVSLPLFYPSLAVYEPGPTATTGQWWLERGTARGDAAFNYASLFVVTATLPSDQIPVASGTLISSTRSGFPTLLGDAPEPDEEGEEAESAGGPQWTRHVWVTGPSREFLLHTSNRFQQASTEAYDTRITSYWLPGHEAAGMAALQHTAAALRIFSDYFGPYPYTDLRVASAPINFRGMEYPQAYLLGIQLYDQYRNELEIRAAHEVAHQWWYQMVHNDPVNLPWIDEGLAEYATRIYYESMQGTAYAQNLQDRRWQAVLDNLIFRGQDEPISLPVMGYADARIYEAIVYGKGALFFDRIRTALGERAFRAFLREYLETYRYAIVGHKEIWQLLAQYDPQVADSLFENWIGEIPAVERGSGTGD